MFMVTHKTLRSLSRVPESYPPQPTPYPATRGCKVGLELLTIPSVLGQEHSPFKDLTTPFRTTSGLVSPGL